MKDSEIEAGVVDTIVDDVTVEISAARGWKHRDGADLCMTVREVSREIIERLRAAGISDITIANALVHEPARARDYYTRLSELHQELDSVAGDEAASYVVRLQITILKISMHGKYGKLAR